MSSIVQRGAREYSAGRRPARRAKQARSACEPCGLAHRYDLPSYPKGLRGAQRRTARPRPPLRSPHAPKGFCGPAARTARQSRLAVPASLVVLAHVSWIRKGSGRDLDVFEVCFSKIDGYVWDMEGIYACM